MLVVFIKNLGIATLGGNFTAIACTTRDIVINTSDAYEGLLFFTYHFDESLIFSNMLERVCTVVYAV